jgi:hypothetical protein
VAFSGKKRRENTQKQNCNKFLITVRFNSIFNIKARQIGEPKTISRAGGDLALTRGALDTGVESRAAMRSVRALAHWRGPRPKLAEGGCAWVFGAASERASGVCDVSAMCQISSAASTARRDYAR